MLFACFSQSVQQVICIDAGRVIVAALLLLVAAQVFSLKAACADCCRHGADSDYEGDCAEVGAVLQQNRVLLGVATA